jgi:hypothetical protein
MGIFLVIATENLRATVAQACPSFYMPFAHFAVVAFDGSQEELAKRLDLNQDGSFGFFARCWNAKSALAVLTGLAVVAVIAGRLRGALP